MFRSCSKCGDVWETREVFLTDENLRIIGYQPHFQELKLGLFLFNLRCGTTLSLRAEDFLDLYEGTVFTERLQDTPACPGYCLHQSELRPCPAQCECAFIREIMNIIIKRQNGGEPLT